MSVRRGDRLDVKLELAVFELCIVPAPSKITSRELGLDVGRSISGKIDRSDAHGLSSAKEAGRFPSKLRVAEVEAAAWDC